MWPAFRLADRRTPLASSVTLPRAREHRQQAVSFALIAALEHDSRDAVQSLATFVFGFHEWRNYTIWGNNAADRCYFWRCPGPNAAGSRSARE